MAAIRLALSFVKILQMFSFAVCNSPWTSVLDFEDLNLDGAFVEFEDSCSKDDRMYFYVNGVFKQDNWIKLCDTDDDPNEVFEVKWLLESNDQYLTIEAEFDDIKYYIVRISSQQAILNVVDPDNAPNQYTRRIVLSR
ncbi:MAG: hypothetical protein KGS48_10095 [Bacteroidetes bacterium]|nr:hypothetical protein [Bacteroidota bacterium]